MLARNVVGPSGSSSGLTAVRRWSTYALVALMIATLVAPAPAAADPEPDVSWMEVNSFINHEYKDVPLREGQHDWTDWTGRKRDGFGVRHIQDSHPEGVPPEWEIRDTIGDESKCVHSPWEGKWRCWDGETQLLVVYTFNGHYDAPREDRDEPVGIITAYRMLGPPCLMTSPKSPRCGTPEAAASILHYSGPDSAVNGRPLRVSTYLTDQQGIAARGRDVSF